MRALPLSLEGGPEGRRWVERVLLAGGPARARRSAGETIWRAGLLSADDTWATSVSGTRRASARVEREPGWMSEGRAAGWWGRDVGEGCERAEHGLQAFAVAGLCARRG